jgi:hypothetical protein
VRFDSYIDENFRVWLFFFNSCVILLLYFILI